MNCLTQQQIAQWLSDRNVTAAPYGNADAPTHYFQFNVPGRPLANASFIRRFLETFECEMLVHITDWPTYQQSEMEIVDALRHDWNEAG